MGGNRHRGATQKGTKLKSYVDKLTAEKWQKVADLHKYAVAYENASPADKKTATFHFLEAHMKATVDPEVPSEPAVAG